MTEHRWSQVREDTIDQFAGETPGAQLEQDILTHFADDPERVLRSIQRIAATEGLASRWAVLRSDLTRTAQADVVASNTKSRQKLVDRAMQWILNAGVHYDHEQHILAELFGDEYSRGPLHDHRQDGALRTHLIQHWQAHRHLGAKAELEHEAWNATAKANRLALTHKETQCPSSHSSTASAATNQPPTPTHAQPTTSAPVSSSAHATNTPTSSTNAAGHSSKPTPKTKTPTDTPTLQDIPLT